MENDSLRLFNTKLVETIASMSDDELWNFVLDNVERAKQYREDGVYLASGFYYGLPGGMEHFRKCFLRAFNDYREGVVFSLVMDFCFEGKKLNLDYWARCGFLDSADSCDVKTCDEVLPPVDEDSEAAYHKEYFHLLEPHHVENIIQAMERNFAKLTINTQEDIDKLKKMKQRCLTDEDYKVVYIYAIDRW
ncbi:MAG TPA: hypothetical protein VGB00_13075 [Pyrinomonadaceae bacterium]|jgi:hypothetical protein